MSRSLAGAIVCVLLAGAALGGGSIARACTVDQRPSASADGMLARLNPQQPATAAQLAVWAPFVFPRAYTARQTVALTEDRRQIARVLVPAALRRPWRWQFTDGSARAGSNTVTYGWTVRHAFAHPGQWRVDVDAYDPGTKRWYPFDQVALVVRGPLCDAKGVRC